MGEVRALWRHPIKGHGREALDAVTLEAGQTFPWDRRWAVAHDAAKTDGATWAAPANFSRAAKAPALMAITTTCDEATGMVTLSHPALSSLTFDPDKDAGAFLSWVSAIMPEDRAQSTRILRVDGRGMTDTDYASISLINLASHDDMAARMEVDLSVDRWRCNIHFDGVEAWQEMGWIGKTLRIGGAQMTVREPITRCMATAANPATGQRDLDTLGALQRHQQHQDFGIYAEVTQSGPVALGDTIEVLGA